MAIIHPGDVPLKDVAAALLALTPSERRREIEYFPAPPRFSVPEDIARVYERSICATPTPSTPPARGVRRGRGEAASTAKAKKGVS